MSESFAGPSGLVDTALDRSVVLGYSRIGYAVRRRLPGWPADPAPGALTGRHVAVTGPTSGIGKATVDDLLRLGAHVHLVARDEDRARAVADATGAAERTTIWRCDLGDLESVREFAERLAESQLPLHALVHNAGVMPPERTDSPQGHELSTAVHVLGPVLATELLHRRNALPDRIVFVTSGGMYTQRLPVADPDYRDGDYRPPVAYARSKRAQVELLGELARRWQPAAVWAMHPGWAATPGVTESLPGFERLTRPILRDAAGAADTISWLVATDPTPATGTLWHDRRERPTHLLPTIAARPSEVAAYWNWVQEAIADWLD